MIKVTLAAALAATTMLAVAPAAVAKPGKAPAAAAAKFTDKYAGDPTQVTTPGLQWQIRCNGQPRDPYLTFDRIINPWGLSGFPISLRLEEGCTLEFAVRNVGPSTSVAKVGGRLLGRYWYNTNYGGAPNRL